MAADASYLRKRDDVRVLLAAAAAAGEMRQLSDGRAAVLQGLNAAAANDTRSYKTDGQYTVPKLAGVSLLDGGRAYWDYSANNVTFEKVNDRDFYLGRIVGDAASADTECVVNLNVTPTPDIDMLGGEGGFLSVATGTQALGGFLPPQRFGKTGALTLTATSEVQCVDMLSVDKFDKNANPIAEYVVRVGVNGSTSAVDLNFGLANGTSASDADAVTEHVFFHIDGGSLAINAQSKDGTTTVAAADTTKVFVAGSAVTNRFELWIDARDTANVKLYVDGVRVLSGSTFKIDNATGPFGLLAHLEKSTGTATCGPVYVDRAEVRLIEQ